MAGPISALFKYLFTNKPFHLYMSGAILLIIIFIVIALVLAALSDRAGALGGSDWAPVIEDGARGKKMLKYGEEIWDSQTDHYMPPATDKQISTVMTRGSAQHRRALIGLLMKALKKPKNYTEKLGVLREIMSGPAPGEYLPDSEIYKSICKHFSYQKDARDTNRALDILQHIAPYRAEIGPVRQFLDVGCGDGGITRDLAKGLGGPTTHCVEVWRPESPAEGITFHLADGGPDAKFPYNDGQFDFVSAIVSLHHIKYLGATIAEIGRVLRPGGYCYIKEHDCWDAFDAMLIDIEHAIYIKCFNEGDENGFPEGYLYQYKNAEGWKEAMEAAGLEFITRQYYNWGPKEEIGPTRIFWALFKKKGQ